MSKKAPENQLASFCAIKFREMFRNDFIRLLQVLRPSLDRTLTAPSDPKSAYERSRSVEVSMFKKPHPEFEVSGE